MTAIRLQRLPTSDCLWWIQDWAGQGLGSKIIAELLSQLATHFKKVRLGYVESNPQASHFWSKVGFCPTGEVKELAGKTIVLVEYALDE
ncbi:GNAT family N-acetyltransferase [Streptococcus suis]